MRLLENRARATLATTAQINTALTCGGGVEAGLQCSVAGRSANLHVVVMAPKHPTDPSLGKVAERLGLAIIYIDRLNIAN
jgi:hypothetical protein